MPTETAPPRRYTTANAAKRLGVTPQYVRRLGDDGTLPAPQAHPDVPHWHTWDAAAVDALATARATEATA